MNRTVDAFITIHDVAPDTLDNVRVVLEELPEPCQQNLTLLVIPGKAWTSEGIAQLREWQQQGYHLAGHGWHHHAKNMRGWYHRLHALLISRSAAEHLALNQEQILSLVQRNFEWFKAHDLQLPNYYVPPAWAMGAIRRQELKKTPFRYFELGAGLYDAHLDRFVYLPLAGFEADTRLRKVCLLLWNRINRALSNSNRPLRISIHPYDFQLQLRKQLRKECDAVRMNHSYTALFNNSMPAMGNELLTRLRDK